MRFGRKARNRAFERRRVHDVKVARRQAIRLRIRVADEVPDHLPDRQSPVERRRFQGGDLAARQQQR